MDVVPGASGILQFLTLIWCALFGCGSEASDKVSPPSSAVSSYGRQVEIHSRVLYQVSIVILVEDPKLSQKDVAEAVSKVCAQPKVTQVIIKKKTFDYGWLSAPDGIQCRVEARGQDDFKVTVRGKDGLTSINGNELQ
jgi:hypothetical protein